MKKHIGTLLLTGLLISCTIQSKSNEDSSREINGMGFIRLEKKCFILETEKETYFPINLNDDLKIEGIRVKFKLQIIPHAIKDASCTDFQPAEIKEIIPYRK
ncbi:hypothetical protein [Moheibacter sediminis]|uniref:Lipoprotein n=1 Tax=Moheibacter sediminis TaxID=1434700 RepID=A0A1W2A717_9FLAO|nr:hypothetical protein [Moheibacter sediminis]SMC56474.1 hypothetical protein SAMN06296427_1043 [Moheibacter sediminis]